MVFMWANFYYEYLSLASAWVGVIVLGVFAGLTLAVIFVFNFSEDKYLNSNFDADALRVSEMLREKRVPASETRRAVSLVTPYDKINMNARHS